MILNFLKVYYGMTKEVLNMILFKKIYYMKIFLSYIKVKNY